MISVQILVPVLLDRMVIHRFGKNSSTPVNLRQEMAMNNGIIAI